MSCERRYARLCHLMVNVRVRGYKIAREPSGPSSSILCHIAGIVRQGPVARFQRTFSPQGGTVEQPSLPPALTPN